MCSSSAFLPFAFSPVHLSIFWRLLDVGDDGAKVDCTLQSAAAVDNVADWQVDGGQEQVPVADDHREEPEMTANDDDQDCNQPLDRVDDADVVVAADVDDAVVAYQQQAPADDSKQSRDVVVRKPRFYDREEIRKYMNKKKKERSEKQAAPATTGFVCNHSRSRETTRTQSGHHESRTPSRKSKPPPAAPAVDDIFAEKYPTYEKPHPNWGPYDVPNFTTTFPDKEIHSSQRVGDRKVSRHQFHDEKSIQTEAQKSIKADQAIQVSMASDNNNECETWLVTRDTQTAPDIASAVTTFHLDNRQTTTTISSSSSSSRTTSMSLENLMRPHPSPEDKRHDNLISKIEHLEQFIGRILVEQPFRGNLLSLPATTTFDVFMQKMTPFEPTPSSSFQQAAPFHAQAEPAAVHPKTRNKTKTSYLAPTKRVDTTASTQYLQLPDQLDTFLRLKKKPAAAPPPADVPYDSYRAGRHKLFPADNIRQKVNPPGSMDQAKRAETAPVVIAEEPLTYFRDFNEILQMDSNNKAPRRRCSNTWDKLELPQTAPYNVLSAVNEHLAADAARHIPFMNSTTSDSDLKSTFSSSSSA